MDCDGSASCSVCCKKCGKEKERKENKTMKIPLEEYIPYRISALIVLAVFFGIYLVKQWRQ